MALTQISTNGVKTNTLTSDDIASSAITVSELAIDAVEDDRIKTSNSPAAGKFLQYKDASDKLTWADANQYIHPDHSGEVTSTADGAQVIASNVVDEDNLKISNAGTNGQFLQKQSGNTGGLTWETVNASPSVTANADGAIGAGDAVIMQANGTVKKVAATVTEQTPSQAVTKTVVDSGNTVHHSMAVSPEGIHLNFYRDNSNSNYPTVRAGKVNTAGDGFDFGTEFTLQTDSVTVFDVIYLTTKNGNPIFSCCYAHSTHTFVIAVMVNASTLACTKGSANNFYGVLVHAKQSKFGSDTVWCVAGSVYNNAYLYRVWSYDNSANTVGNITETQSGIGGSAPGGSGNSYVSHNSLVYDPDTERLWHFFRYHGGNKKGYTVELDIEGQTTIASGDIGTPVAWNNNMSGTNSLQVEHIDSCYDTENNRVIIVFTDESDSKKTKAMAATIDTAGDGSKYPSWGSTLEIFNDQSATVQIIFDPVIKKAVVVHSDEDDTKKLRFNVLTLNTSNNSLTKGTEFNSGFTEDTSSNRINMGYDANRDLIIKASEDDSSPGDAVVMAVKTSTTTTNAESFLGFNQSAVTNGNAATIDIVGATNENQSSLTVGSKYYVQKNGSLSTTADNPSVVAGTAVAATKLVVKG